MSAKKFNAGMEQHPKWHSGKVMMHGYAFYNGVGLRT